MACIICTEHFEVQQSPTEEHHVIHDRGSQRKTPDHTTIPLCDGHHQGKFDQSKVAIHKEPELWRDLYGADYSYVEMVNERDP